MDPIDLFHKHHPHRVAALGYALNYHFNSAKRILNTELIAACAFHSKVHTFALSGPVYDEKYVLKKWQEQVGSDLEVERYVIDRWLDMEVQIAKEDDPERLQELVERQMNYGLHIKQVEPTDLEKQKYQPLFDLVLPLKGLSVPKRLWLSQHAWENTKRGKRYKWLKEKVRLGLDKFEGLVLATRFKSALFFDGSFANLVWWPYDVTRYTKDAVLDVVEQSNLSTTWRDLLARSVQVGLSHAKAYMLFDMLLQAGYSAAGGGSDLRLLLNKMAETIGLYCASTKIRKKLLSIVVDDVLKKDLGSKERSILQQLKGDLHKLGAGWDTVLLKYLNPKAPSIGVRRAVTKFKESIHTASRLRY